MAATDANDIHILVFPYPAQGHMLALLDLTHQLVLQGFKATILVTSKNLPLLEPLLSTHPNSIQTLILPFPSHSTLPSGVENVKDIGNSGNAPIIAALSTLEGEVIGWFRNHPSPPRAILSDFFLGFTHSWAEQLNITSIGFFSVGAILVCVLHHLLQNIDSIRNLKVVDFPHLPRSISLVQDHLPSIIRKYRQGDSDWMIVRESLLANYKADSIVFNSFHALEEEYLDHMKVLAQGGVYAVGPISSIARHNPDNEGKNSILNWLDRCPGGRVLYACFGSQKQLTTAQIEALALGLERSKAHFVWVIKAADGQHLPDGFQERNASRGLVVTGWAPQVEILNHRAVGGFVSHCGWNSTLESIMAGVMVLAWPMEADQFVNAKLLEYQGIAIRLCEGEHTVPDPDELAQIISKSLVSNVPQRERAKVMRDKAFEAVKDGGSSSKSLDELVRALKKLKQ